MSFAVAGDVYDRFVGRYSRLLAPRFLDFAGVVEGPVLDVGAGPGALTSVLAGRFGAASVSAVEPSEPFAAACRARVPGVDVRVAPAESLPFAGLSFSASLSQLVLSFVTDAGKAASEMARVVRLGGTVAACTFDADGFALARTFWKAARRFDPGAPDDARLPFRREGELIALWTGTGLRDVTPGVIDIEAMYAGFEDFWDPFAHGVGPPGGWLVRQPETMRAEIREACREILGHPTGPFSLPARVLAIRGRT